jgi:hypothetical protein
MHLRDEESEEICLRNGQTKWNRRQKINVSFNLCFLRFLHKKDPIFMQERISLFM